LIKPVFGTIFAGFGCTKVRSYRKIVAIDTDFHCIGSYNWLSADRHGQYASGDVVRLSRAHLEEEISTIVGSLRRRVA
jgi:hypothetical protein